MNTKNKNQQQFLLQSQRNKFVKSESNGVIDDELKQKRFFIQNKIKLLIGMEILVIIILINTQAIKYWYKFDNEIWISLIYVDNYKTYILLFILSGSSTIRDDIIGFSYQNVGVITFTILMISFILQIIEIIRMFKYSKGDKISKTNKYLKGKIIHILILLSLSSTFGGYFVFIILMSGQSQRFWYFGISYWLGVGCIFIYVGIIVGYRKAKGSAQRQRFISQMWKFDKFPDSQYGQKKGSINDQ